MANNKVIFGNTTVMDISDSTVTEDKLLDGEVAYNAAGQRIQGTYSPPDVSTKYDSNDTTESDLADDDKMPFYDDSASTRRNSTWANIKAKLKTYFDTLYTTLSHNHSISFGISSSSAMDLAYDTKYKIDIKSPDNLSINEITFKTPSAPATVNNGTLTIKQAGSSKGTFTANQSSNTTIELTDTNTWRGIQDNLTSSSTTDSLSANQGRLLAGGSARDNTKEPKHDWKTSGNWHYYKDSSNVYHLHYHANASINFNGAIGNLKYRTTTFDINLPVTLSSYYSVTVSVLCGNDVAGATIQSATASQIKLWLWAATSGTKSTYIEVTVVSV